MTTTYTLNDWESGAVIRWKINDSLSNLNSWKAETTALTAKQDTLLSGTNIKTINTISLLWGGDISIPALTDWVHGDVTITSWNFGINDDVVTFAKMQNIATNTILIRTTAWTWDIEAWTPTQVAWMLPVATTSAAWTMSASDKTKIDSVRSTGLIYSSTTEVVVTNTVALTSVWSTTLEWWYLATWGVRIRWFMTVSSVYQDYRWDCLIDIRYWGSTIASTYVLNELDWAEQWWYFECVIHGTGTSSQSAFLDTMLSKLSIWGSFFRPLVSYAFGSWTVNSESSQTIEVFFQNGIASWSVTSKCKYLLIEKI